MVSHQVARAARPWLAVNPQASAVLRRPKERSCIRPLLINRRCTQINADTAEVVFFNLRLLRTSFAKRLVHYFPLPVRRERVRVNAIGAVPTTARLAKTLTPSLSRRTGKG